MKHIFLRSLPLFFIAVSYATAAQFPLPASGNSLLGEVRYTTASSFDTPVTLAQRYDLGLNAMIAANPGSSQTDLGPHDIIKIPTAFLLPPIAHKGIVVNLPEMRLYYYPENKQEVITLPVGIGKVGTTIPIQRTTVTQKKINPTWTPTANIRKYNADQGVDLPNSMPAGPDNPLGPYAIYLGIPTYLIHSTIYPDSIGRRASFGCIRMKEDDIKTFFPLVTKGTPVIIINMPNKVGWQGNHLYLEAHPLLEEHDMSDDDNMGAVVQEIEAATPSSGMTLINWPLAANILQQPDGIPHSIGVWEK